MARAPERSRLEYHRSHLRYYRKHNGALAQGALRALLAGRAVALLVRGVLAGSPAERATARRLLALALGRG